MLGNRVGALIAKGVQLSDEGFAFDPFSLGNPARELADAESGEQPLRCGARGMA